jgi:hypothetical protein
MHFNLSYVINWNYVMRGKTTGHYDIMIDILVMNVPPICENLLLCVIQLFICIPFFLPSGVIFRPLFIPLILYMFASHFPFC